MLPPSPAFWSVLPQLPVSWDAPPEEVTLPGGHTLTLQHAPGNTPYLTLILHASEDFTALFDGRGEYTPEEHEDPYSVLEERWDAGREVMWDRLAEAMRVLGQPPRTELDRPGRTSWLLPDHTLTVGLAQADNDCPIEVRLWVWPPELTPDRLGL